MKNNSECFDSVMKKSSEIIRVKNKQKQIIARTLPGVLSLVLVVCAFPVLRRMSQKSDIDASDLSDRQTTAENYAVCTIYTQVSEEEVNSESLYSYNSATITSVTETALMSLSDSYTTSMSYEQICAFFGVDIKPDTLVATFTDDNGDYGADVSFAATQPENAAVVYTYGTLMITDSPVNAPVLTVEITSYDCFDSHVENYDEPGCESAYINGNKVYLFSDELQNLRYCMVKKGRAYLNFYASNITANDFALFISAVI